MDTSDPRYSQYEVQINDGTSGIKYNQYEVWINGERTDCLHDKCPECNGTGQNAQGICVHYLSCPCKKCTPFC